MVLNMISADQLLRDLNPVQREAVWMPPGPLLIVAGAGSGKTRVLTHRIAHFIASNIAPHHILAITFTNKAADEMRNRVAKLLQDQNPPPPLKGGAWRHTPPAPPLLKGRGNLDSRLHGNDNMPFVGTFHSLALRILREDAPEIGIAKSFVIADESDSLGIMKRIMKRLKISPEELTPSDALNRISREKSELREPQDMACKDDKEEMIRSLYEQYQQILLNESLLDFDDLLFFATKLFQKNPEVLEKYQRRFQHIFVDEYQDTNTVQYTLVGLLAKSHKSITVVGDDYQAIYGWRNADYRNILNFQKDYPDAKVIKLEQNYRSTQTILDAADAIIKKVSARTEKTLVATRPPGALVSITELPGQEEEAAFIIDTICAMQKKGASLSDAVVLYRTNAQSRPFEELLLRERIPYRITGGTRFYERKEVKDMLAFLRYLKNENDRTALERIINIPPRGIGKVGLERIVERGLDAAAEDSPAARDFRAMMRLFREKQPARPLAQFIKELLSAINYKTYLREAYASSRTWRADEFEERWENIEELISTAKKYDQISPATALENFLEDIALFSSADTIDASGGMLNLMTMHLAKGLEYPAVFLAGCEEGLLPHARSMFNSEALDEERRLCYVAITRAKDTAHLTFVRERTTHGERSRRLPSRFISEIPEHLVHYEGRDLSEPELVEEWE